MDFIQIFKFFHYVKISSRNSIYTNKYVFIVLNVNIQYSLSLQNIIKILLLFLQETAETEDVKETVKTEVEIIEVEAPISEANGDVETVANESSKTTTEETATEDVQASAEKKRKKKKSWSFRSISFSKKDKSKPAVKEQAAVDVKTETVEEVRYITF